MKTREEAVAYLTDRGFHAERRDWVMDEAIVLGTESSEERGMTVYRRAMYLVRKGNGWTGSELDHPRADDDDIVSLDQACERAIRLLSTALERS